MAGVFPERLEESRVHQVVNEVRRFLHEEEQLAQGTWFVPEEAFPPGLGDRLRTLGMRPSDQPGLEPRGAAMVAVRAPQPAPTDVVVRRVDTLDDYLAAQLVTADVFEMDDEFRQAFVGRAQRLWEVEHTFGLVATFVALIDGEVVASARAYFGQTAVFLTGGGTRPDARGRGAYRALVRARWDAAAERGTPALTVGAGEMSRPILERLGFTIVGWYDCLLDDLASASGLP
jgi:hypothetical protein